MSLDLLFFFVFWEFGLVPMYFLINQWGSANRNYASLKFMIYTMAGSLGLLLAIQLIGVLFGTYDLLGLYQRWGSLAPEAMLLGMPVATVKTIAFWAFVIAFADQGPGVALPHLAAGCAYRGPDRRLDDPGGCAAEAGRIWLPAPGPAALSRRSKITIAGALAFLATDGHRLWRACAAYAQTDFKRLVAYSSVNHMGFVVLGYCRGGLRSRDTGRNHRLERSHPADVQPRPVGGGHVLPGRCDL